MTALLATVRKECLLLLRDFQGLMLLFAMPVVFILIMSLALQNQFAQNRNPQKIINVILTAQPTSEKTKAVFQQLQKQTLFNWKIQSNAIDWKKQLRQGDVHFLLTLTDNAGEVGADITVSPNTNAQIEAIFTATVSEAIYQYRMSALLSQMQILSHGNIDTETFQRNTVRIHYGLDDESDSANTQPTSVQQNVPAWLVFAMFFSVVPLANTLINERQQGTLRRLRTLPISPVLPIIGKWLPYFVINQIQVVLMLLVGVYLMPLLGADSLTLGHSFAGLLLMSIALSVAALGYGILIAVTSRTTEQATTLGGVGNILLAAIGGIMVPKFIMPEAMQHLANFSPMSWGLEGFLDLFLRHGNVSDVLPEAGLLLTFGSVCTVVATLLFRRKAL
jgi:ABC-2 type transport system permease protein